MDEHGGKAIYIGAGIGIALLIIGLVIGGVTMMRKTISSGYSRASKLAGQMQESTYTQYDGETLKGDQVLAIMKQFQDDTIAIQVEINGQAEEYIYTDANFTGDDGTCTIPENADRMTAGEFADAMKDARDKTSSKYIAPTGDFTCTVCRNPDTQAITGLKFVLQD